MNWTNQFDRRLVTVLVQSSELSRPKVGPTNLFIFYIFWANQFSSNRTVQDFLFFFPFIKTTLFWCFWHRNDVILESYITKWKSQNLQAATSKLQPFLLRPPSMRPSRDTKTNLVDSLRHPYRSRRRPTTPTQVLSTLENSPSLLRPPSTCPSRDTKTDPVDGLRHPHKYRQHWKFPPSPSW